MPARILIRPLAFGDIPHGGHAIDNLPVISGYADEIHLHKKSRAVTPDHLRLVLDMTGTIGFSDIP